MSLFVFISSPPLHAPSFSPKLSNRKWTDTEKEIDFVGSDGDEIGRFLNMRQRPVLKMYNRTENVEVDCVESLSKTQNMAGKKKQRRKRENRRVSFLRHKPEFTAN
ncbi:hypothetical protein PoB_006578500 [Plakobranchus ocellatus]|uniref:Uncharacterized protein n=1 Tax=Plakobranchus ocellatus TaxID=259542 RepID=A0AAV4D554_9GAST|nr:hypothetical protein PoB_006578500 [Plakobranchus ocellatus]